MKMRIVIGVVLASGLAQGAYASDQSPPHWWQGQYLVSAASSQCATYNTDGVGSYGTMIYRPIVNAGDPPEAISIISPHSASIYISTAAGGSLQGSASYAGTRISSAAQLDQFTGSSSLKMTPTVIQSTTTVVSVTGHINNWFDHTGCSITFRAEMQRIQ